MSIGSGGRLDSEDKFRTIHNLIEECRIKGEANSAKILLDHNLWNHSPKDLQDLAIRQVASCLGSQFQELEAEEYVCRDLACRIGRFKHTSTGYELHLLPGGPFWMGALDGDEDACDEEYPRHRVTSDPFLIGRFPVTQEVWDVFGGDDDRQWEGKGIPIDTVVVSDIENWFAKVDNGFRLPSESEWEYACRGFSQEKYYFGTCKTSLSDYAVFNGNSGDTIQPVGTKPCNAFGLQDMLGNVWEWCQDHFVRPLPTWPNKQSTPYFDVSLTKRVLRGASWLDKPWVVTCTSRFPIEEDYADYHIGFRACVDLRSFCDALKKR